MTLAGIGRVLSSPKNVSLGVITSCMIFRPIITMSNKNIPDETKKYTAAREFCTEVFNLLNTYTFVSAVEYLLPKVILRKEKALDLSKKGIDLIKKANIGELLPPQQKLKGAVLLSSFLGAAFSCAILTPALNNIFLCKIIDKVTGTKQKKISDQNTDVFKDIKEFQLKTGFNRQI